MPVDIQTILVATDFSDASAPATAYAFSLARALTPACISCMWCRKTMCG